MSSWPLNGKKGGNRKHSKIDTLPPEMKATVEEMIMDGSATYSDIVTYQGSPAPLLHGHQAAFRQDRGGSRRLHEGSRRGQHQLRHRPEGCAHPVHEARRPEDHRPGEQPGRGCLCLRLSHGGHRQGIQEYAVWHVLQPRPGVRRIYYGY